MMEQEDPYFVSPYKFWSNEHDRLSNHPLMSVLFTYMAGLIVAYILQAKDFDTGRLVIPLVLIEFLMLVFYAWRINNYKDKERTWIEVSLWLTLPFVYGIIAMAVTNRYGDANSVIATSMEPVLSEMASLREWLDSKLYDLLDYDVYVVVSSMTLGIKGLIPYELRDNYNISGASHIFALSGLHLSIMFAVFDYLLPRWGKNWQRTCVLIFVIWLYVMLVGGRPSVVRAAFMLSLYSIMETWDLNSGRMSVLLHTVLVLLLLRPSWMFDVGCQMSVMAVYSIMTMMPVLVKSMPGEDKLPHSNACGLKIFQLIYWISNAPSHRNKVYIIVGEIAYWYRAVWALFALSLSAQIGVAPLIVYYFKRFSTYFFVTNFVVTPCAFLILVLTLVVLILVFLSAILPLLGFVLDYIIVFGANALQFVVRAMNNSVIGIASWRGASFDCLHINDIQIVTFVIGYSVVAYNIYKIYCRRQHRLE